ncbi:MAG: PP2C family protein-serine/threonine phosphatase, partial [Chthoniobacterales bacterium]
EYFAGLVAGAVGRVRAQAAALERAALQRDLDLARELQKGLLPLEFPSPELSPAIDLFASLQPAKEVSGDLYDFFFIEPGKLCFVVGDVSGKGLAAGIFMAMTRTLLRAIARPDMSPAQILTQLNTELCRDNDACLFVTMILGIVDVATGELVCGLGGHNAPVHVTRESAQLGPLGGAPLGLMPEAKFAEWRPELASGDALLVYTDGVPEALDESRQLFTNERFLSVLRPAVPSSSRGLVGEVEKALAAFVGQAERSDDVTLMALVRRS